MTRHGPILLGLSVLAVAGWAYSVNYDTRAALDRLSKLRGEIAEERERLQVLRVEWAFLNAPDRLARLIAEHEAELGLAALTPEALGYVAAVPYSPDAAPKRVPEQPETPPVAPPEALIAAAPAAEPAAGAIVAPAPAPAETALGDKEMLIAGLAPTAHAAAEHETAPAAILENTAAGAGAAELRAAIAAALAEAGVPVRQEVAAVIPASASPGAPLPLARPGGWIRP